VVAAVAVSVAVWWTRAGAGRTDGAGPPEALVPPADDLPATSQLPSSKAPSRPGVALYDPVQIGPCNLVPAQEQEVASQLEGTPRSARAEVGRAGGGGEGRARLATRLRRPQVELLEIKGASDAARLMARTQLADIDRKLTVARKRLANRAYPAGEVEALVFSG